MCSSVPTGTLDEIITSKAEPTFPAYAWVKVASRVNTADSEGKVPMEIAVGYYFY